MTFAQIINDKIVTVTGRIPNVARRLDTRLWVGNLPDASPADQRACGWFQVTDVTRPADTDTVTHDRTIGMVAGAPTVVWTAREFTADEQAALTADSNRRTIDAAITRALAELDALINAPDVPTVPAGTLNNAQLSNTLREMRERVQQNRNGIKRVARTLRHTIRLARGDFDATD